MINKTNGRDSFFVFLLCLFMLPVLTGCGKSKISVPEYGYNSDNAAGSRVGISVVRTARSQIGRPYQWGGADPDHGFDCSGLVWWVYRRHGIRVPRVSWQQARVGRPVSINRLAAGDIVLFRIPGQGKSLHTGIYSGRGGFFIHSPKSGHVVREESMNKTYWRKYFIGARRVL